MYRLVVKNSLIYGVLPQLPKVASFFTLPLVTPFLTPTDYGVIGVVEVYLGLFSVLHLLGLPVVVTNAFYKHPASYKMYWRQLFGFLLLWSVPFVVVLAAVLFFVLPPEARDNATVIIVLKTLPFLLFAPAELFMSAYYRLSQKAWPVAGRAFISGGVAVVLNYFFIAELQLGFMGWIYSAFVALVVSGVLYLVPLTFTLRILPIFNFKWRVIRNALKVSLPVLPHNYSGYLLNSSDRLVMERSHVPVENIGLYSLAYSLGGYVNVVTGAVSQAIGPNLLECVKKERWNDYGFLVTAFQSLIFFACLTISLWIPEWMPLLIRNQEFQVVQPLIIIVLMSYCYRPMYIGCNQVLFYFEKTSILWKISTVAGLLNIVLNIILIPFFGYQVAAWTTFVAFMFMGFSGFLHRDVKQLNQAKLFSGVWFVVIVGSLAVLLMVYQYSAWIKLILNASVLAALMLTTRRTFRLRTN